MKIRLKHLLSLVLPLIALSGCSYRGSINAMQDGNILMSESYERHIDTFETVDCHIKLGHPFCLFISMDGCYECEKFEENLPSVIESNKLLLLHLEIKNGSNEVNRFFEAYPEAKPENLPSVIIVEGRNFNILPFEQINSKSRFVNTLKRNISLTNRYYVTGDYGFMSVFNKTGLDNAALIMFNSKMEDHIQKYNEKLSTIEGPLIVLDQPWTQRFNFSKKIIL